MTKKDFQIFITGPAGSGVKSAGKFLQKLLNTYYHTFGSVGYYSLIKGGRNYFCLRISQTPIYSNTYKSDLLVALNKDCLFGYLDRLKPKGILILDNTVYSSLTDTEKEKLKQYKLMTQEFIEKAKEKQILPISYLLVIIGFLSKSLSVSLKKAQSTVKKNYSKAPSHIIESNKKALQLGFELNKDLKIGVEPIRRSTTNKVIDCAYASSLGFIKAEGKIFTAYPMTPSTPILHYLAKMKKKYKIIVRQASTEIEAVGFAIGANWAFARTLVATSGGGLDLMGEFISMAGMAEIPLVIINAQRPGPSTGLPTWTDQGDLDLVKAIGHGEFPRIVLAPYDAKSSYIMIQQAFNLAEKYQTVVFVLLDKHLTTSLFETKKQDITRKIPIERGKIDKNPKLDKNGFYPRYRVTEDGVSPRPILGHPQSIHITNSDEHDIYGFSVEAGNERVVQHSKRLLKEKTILKKEYTPPLKLIANKGADIAVVSWGSTMGAVYEALTKLGTKTQNFTYYHFTWLYPLNYVDLTRKFSRYKKVILIENNASSQLRKELERANIKVTKTILKFDGEPFFVDTLYNQLAKIIRKTDK